MSDPSDPVEPVRLSKCVIALTGCSRREAEFYIEGGSVLVDGQVVDEPQFKISGQTVELKAGARPDPVEPVTLLLHKPAGHVAEPVGERSALELITPESRAVDDDPGMHILKRHFVRLALAMPLEADASGLVVYTQDWQVSRKLIEDVGSIEQEYVVEVSGQIVAGGLESLHKERRVNNWLLPAVKVSWQSEARLRFAGKALDAATIRSLCASVGLQPTSIKRIRIGSIAMSKLPLAQWRYLPKLKRF